MQAAAAGHGQDDPLALVLASSSPQRRAILERLGVPFTARAHATRERKRGEAGELAIANALAKARAARVPGAREVVLGCDTLVALGGRIFGKPRDPSAARQTLRALSGVTHEVVSGLALVFAGEGTKESERTAIARTAVSFRALDEGLLDWYLARGEWRGRAGGYAIQGAGAALVRAVQGDYENVVGLPLATLLDLYPELLVR
ncbi:MAG: Maf family protein [Actinomycetota bacterium]|nr:Maf family protein [Actinomycetota bacterium]